MTEGRYAEQEEEERVQVVAQASVPAGFVLAGTEACAT